MKNLTSNEIRELWLKFFETKKHLVLPSSSLIPVDDKTLLWINSGVATIKSYFDGTEEPPHKRLTNSQKVIRTGDIDNVGITARHHTFFEMLGSFSIGDYFRKEAIEFGWELLTSEEYFSIPKEKIHITVFEEDEEALKFWEAVGVSSNNIFKMGKDTNFWDMGIGPCGPSTEIFFDKGIKYDQRDASLLIKEDIENDRFVEIWNIVFSQFNNNGKNIYTDLPQKNIDTGAGLERITSALQDKPTNFETDLFVKLIQKIDMKSKYEYQYEYIPRKLLIDNPKQHLINSWYKKIADFIRSVSFTISDGAIPDNVGRGYILRMLLRKAVINKNKLEIEENFLHELVEPLIETMGEHYPLLIEKKQTIIKIIKKEEEQFNKTLQMAITKMNNHITDKTLDEKVAYKLHETFGLPLELLKDISISRNDINLDWKKIDKLDKEFKEMSKPLQFDDAMKIQDEIFVGLPKTNFVGYEKLKSSSKVIFISNEFVVFDKTPFYATSGGQMFDEGLANGNKVISVTKNSKKTFIHKIPGHNFALGDIVELEVDKIRRKKLSIHHTSHHLITHALDVVMKQKLPQNSFKAEASYIKFSVVSQEIFSDEIVQKAQNLANKWISEKLEVSKEEIPIEEAKKRGATFLRNAKYGALVRVITINGLVIDMCGGTHVNNLSELENVLITNFGKKGSGVWAFESVAGDDNILESVLIINKRVLEEIEKPLINKINNIKNKMKDATLVKDLDFEKRIYLIDNTKIGYKNELQSLSKSLNKEINDINNEIKDALEKLIIKESSNTIFFKESSAMNIQEITRAMLNVLDNTNYELGVAISNNGEKTTFGFVIPKKNISEINVKRIKEFATKNNLRGNGKEQQYIFGGSLLDNNKLIEEIKKWEF